MLGLPAGATTDDVRAAAIAGISRWRTKAGDPLADPTMIEVCDVAIRTLERTYADVA